MFDQTADLLELRGENPCRVRAYRRATRIVNGLPHSVRTMLKKKIPSASPKPGAVDCRRPTSSTRDRSMNCANC